ncbi:MAG: VOC family protein [Burkholderiales bacterium]|nr:VOC family protein [Burkholderiales bacterium]OUT79299.1 MAG: hypothetical protein CBB82_01715 [Betaproteobacteria bacterium TMED22]
MSDFRLEHVNIPSQNPNDLAKWYAETFGLSADQHVARGDGILIAFQQGTPIKQPDLLHIGFKVHGMAKLHEWKNRFEKPLKIGPEFTSFQILDPEGNCIEIYAQNTSS